MIQMYTIQNFTKPPVQDLEILRGAKERLEFFKDDSFS